MNKRKMGARIPLEIDWQNGKTRESIRFVNDAENFISTCKDAKKIQLLRAAIQEVKDEKLVLQNWLTPKEYLAQYTV